MLPVIFTPALPSKLKDTPLFPSKTKQYHTLSLSPPDALKPVIATLGTSSASQVLSSVVDDVWPLLCHTLDLDSQQLGRQQVLQAAQQALQAIQTVVAEPNSQFGSVGDGSGSSSADEETVSQGAGGKAEVVAGDAWEKVESFAARMELFRGRVKEEVIQKEVDAVSKFAFACFCLPGMQSQVQQL